MRAPRRETRPAIRTTGNGLSRESARWPKLVPGAPGAPTFSTADATLVAFVVMRSETVYVPGAG